MPRPPRQRPLSVFLLKESIGSWRAAVREPDAVRWIDIRAATGVRGALAIGPTAQKTPWWSRYLAPHVEGGDVLTALANRSTAGLLLVDVGERRFAFAFGYGRHLLEPEAYEQDFGLRVALNTIDPDRLMSVDARTIDELTMHTRRDVSRGSPLAAFGLDVNRDLVRAVTGPPRDESLGRRLTGSDALALLSRAQLTELPDLCRRLLGAYESDEYKERFGWIDHLRRVRDVALIARLNELLIERLRVRDLTDMHLAPPEPMPWERLEGFTFSTRRGDHELDADPRISAYVETVASLADIELAELKQHRLQAISADSGLPIETWSIFRSIVFEVREGDLLYALTAGEWYSVSASFAEEVLDFSRGLPELDLAFPGAALGVSEDEYNRTAAEALEALCLDRQLIETPAGDRIELCDLLTREKQLVHVKKRGSSSTLSHLFAQGLVSGELLSREEAFRTAAREKAAEFPGNYDAAIPGGRPAQDEWEIGFVVITRSRRDTPLTLPFFSLVNMRSAVLRLRDLGYRVGVRQVDEG
jgi:uncharacterized protein (TIGR04141 family)